MDQDNTRTRHDSEDLSNTTSRRRRKRVPVDSTTITNASTDAADVNENITSTTRDQSPQRVEYHECSTNKHESNKQQINTSNATSRAPTKISTNYIDAPRNERMHVYSNPPAHSKIKSDGVTTNTALFSGNPSSSFVTRSSNNSSSSQKPQHYSKGEEGSSTEKRQILPSDMHALRECATYVTRVKTTLLASNYDDKLNMFLDLLCNWREQGLTSNEVFSQMQLILQEASPDLLSDFTAFLPVDIQEKARLHIAAASSMMSINTRAYEEGTQEAISRISDNRLDDTDNGEMVQEQGYLPY
eukprot:scaffold12161_cov297-Chaetoceros_neogracile.AAC.9